MRRNILNFVGIGPVRESLFGMVESVSDARRRKWIAAMHALGKRAG
jgi:putative NADPH-quinone reductase